MRQTPNHVIVAFNLSPLLEGGDIFYVKTNPYCFFKGLLYNNPTMIENYDRLSDPDKILMAALPYRVGLWMSTLEGDGGDVADELESMAMIETIERISMSPYYDFAAYIFRQTLALRSRWIDWSSDFSSVPDECRQAMGLLKRTIPLIEATHFAEALFLVAASVARAHREETQAAGLGNFPAFVNRLMGKLQDRVSGYDNHQNISTTEAAALRRLASFLGLGTIPESLR